MSEKYAPIPIIDRMASVLDILMENPNGIRSSDLLRTENIPKTTLYRLLASMTKNGFLSYSEKTGLYSIGAKLMSLCGSVEEQANFLREIAMPHLHLLANQVRETVKLAVLSGMRIYTLATVEGDQPLRISIDPGAIFPLHAGASAKILLSTFSDAMIDHLFFNSTPYTEFTITSAEEMKKELERIRACGYAIDRGEYILEINAVAVPITDLSGRTIAALSVTYPSFSKETIDIPLLASQLAKTARMISEEMAMRENVALPARLLQERPNF